jgi:two-component system NtrC family response regulator/two-component system nitrogen regulation response regulator GlnG
MPSVLIVDDEPSICTGLQRLLEGRGYSCTAVGNAEQAHDAVRRRRPDVALLDVRLPGESGLSLMRQLAASSPAIRFVVMTAYGTMETAIEAMREGAFDYLLKPLDLDRVAQTVDRAVQHSTRPEVAVRADSDPPARGALVGSSPAMHEIYKTIGALTRHDVTVVIVGESGTGKELVARAIHDHSPRGQEPFVAINCGAIPPSLLESELFGHERGSFTDAHETKLGKFEMAGGGTIFLDEIAEMSLSLQVKILRALQEREIERIGGRNPIPIRARILAATHRDLQEQVNRGLFREDLLYRLQVASIRLPPLRERREDLAVLTAAFLGRFAAELRKPVSGISRAALARLQAHRWPGNVRELENVLQRAVVMCRGPIIDVDDLSPLSDDPLGMPGDGVPPADWKRSLRAYAQHRLDARQPGDHLYDDMLLRTEQVVIEAALERFQGNQVATAQALGISRNTLRKRLVQFSLLADDPPAGSTAPTAPPGGQSPPGDRSPR